MDVSTSVKKKSTNKRPVFARLKLGKYLKIVGLPCASRHRKNSNRICLISRFQIQLSQVIIKIFTVRSDDSITEQREQLIGLIRVLEVRK